MSAIRNITFIIPNLFRAALKKGDLVQPFSEDGYETLGHTRESGFAYTEAVVLKKDNRYAAMVKGYE
jgi:hypothetical protein